MSKISVIMSVYRRNRPDRNCPNLLRRAIESILNQSFTDFEYILLDDASTDGSENVCREYAQKDSRIKYVRYDENSGCTARRYNDGMKMAQSPYFMYMFDDDYWYPHAMNSLYEATLSATPGFGMIYGLINLVDWTTGEKIRGFGFRWDLKIIKQQNILGNLSVIVPRTTINAVGGYDENPIFRRNCDWDLWVRIGEKFPVIRVPVMIGCSTSSFADSIGKTISQSKQDWENVKIAQAKERKIRLQGELC